MEPEQTPYIAESEYNAHFARIRQELARQIAFSGLTLAEIAKATRMKWDTVYAASQGRPVRMENAARIQYFLEIDKARRRKLSCEIQQFVKP